VEYWNNGILGKEKKQSKNGIVKYWKNGKQKMVVP
jgi:hypothetical protein